MSLECTCGKTFKNRAGIANHKKYCSGLGTRLDEKKKSASWTCPKCNKHIHSRRERHVEICDGLGGGALKRRKGPGRNWSKGKTYEEIYGDRAKEMKEKVSKLTPARLLANQDPERRKKSAETAKRIGLGGPTKRGGRGKHGWYKGYWCDSSWELAWIIYCLDHQLSFTRNKQGFLYEINGKTRRYYPDFQLSDGSYVEIKGYLSPEFEKKKESFPHELKILTSIELKPILEYVENKYGKNFINLYE
jgi:predicted RNA-binding Zn-ribbon protein involved in translation (DUF1610 family)